jgi:hypothetical protein
MIGVMSRHHRPSGVILVVLIIGFAALVITLLD